MKEITYFFSTHNVARVTRGSMLYNFYELLQGVMVFCYIFYIVLL